MLGLLCSYTSIHSPEIWSVCSSVTSLKKIHLLTWTRSKRPNLNFDKSKPFLECAPSTDRYCRNSELFPAEGHDRTSARLNSAIPHLGWVDPQLLSKYFLRRAFSSFAKLALIPPLAYKSQVKALLPMPEGEGSNDSYIWPHSSFLLTFWTPCKNIASHLKLGIFYLQFRLYVYVGGQERKLLSLVSIPKLN